MVSQLGTDTNDIFTATTALALVKQASVRVLEEPSPLALR